MLEDEADAALLGCNPCRVVSGHIQGETETATLRVEERYQSLDLAGAYAISIVLAVLAVLVLVAMTVIRPKEEAV